MGEPTTEKLDTQTRGHHPDSPSSLQASEACPLFTNEQRESQASLDGTLQHKAAETRDLTILDGNESWIAAVEKCIELEDRLIAELCEPYLTDCGPDAQLNGVDEGRPTVIHEKYLSVGTDIVFDAARRKWVGVTGGFPDTLIVNRSKSAAIIPDWKFGREPVSPTKDNLQGKAYALATFEAFPTVQTVRVIFFAPHQGWSDDEIREKYDHTFHRREMPAMELHVRTVIARKHAAKKDLEEKGDWSAAEPREGLCVFCALKGRCKKNLQLLIKASPKHELINVPEGFGEMEISKPEHVGFAYKLANNFEAIAKAIKGHCVHLALTQDEMLPKGFKLVRRQDREITSLDAVIEAAKRHGVPKKAVLDEMSIPISKIEKLVKAKAEKGLGAAAVRGFGATLEELGAVQLGKPSHFLQEIKTPAENTKIENTQEKALEI